MNKFVNLCKSVLLIRSGINVIVPSPYSHDQLINPLLIKLKNVLFSNKLFALQNILKCSNMKDAHVHPNVIEVNLYFLI